MSDLKNQIFKLLKRAPDCANNNREVKYISDDTYYTITLGEDFTINLSILCSKPCCKWLFLTIELDEKEYMEAKWTIEDWQKHLDAQLLNKFAEFVDTDPETMDDLLND